MDKLQVKIFILAASAESGRNTTVRLSKNLGKDVKAGSELVL